MYKSGMITLTLMLSGWLGMGLVYAQDPADVQRRILDKVPVAQLDVKPDGERVVLEGRTKLLIDKMDAGKIAQKQFKKREVVNNIVVESSGKIDQDITLDVIAQINRDSPQAFVFDDLSVDTRGGNVTLLGKVRNAYLHEIAEEAAMKTEGVRSVDNQIQILPPSLADDRLRLNVLNKLRNDDRLFYYFLGSQPSIQIIVEGSRVTLSGTVDTESDRILAGSLVRQMSGVLSVQNLLKVD